MSARRRYYFRERVTEAELNDGFALLEQADRDLAADLGFVGVIANAVVSQHAPVPDLTVDVSGPGTVIDQLGERIFFSALQNVDVSKDSNGVSTEASAAGKEKTVSVFVKFDRALSDPRVDGNSMTVFFHEDESFKFLVLQGAEAAAGESLPPPLRSDAVLLADVTRSFGQTQILAAKISASRRQDAFVAIGSPRSIHRGRSIEALTDLLAFYNAHVIGTSDRHPAGGIDFPGAESWADGTANPAATVKDQLAKIIGDLAGAAGAGRIGSAPGGSLTAATVQAAIKELDAKKAGLDLPNSFTKDQAIQGALSVTRGIEGTNSGTGNVVGVHGVGGSDGGCGVFGVARADQFSGTCGQAKGKAGGVIGFADDSLTGDVTDAVGVIGFGGKHAGGDSDVGGDGIKGYGGATENLDASGHPAGGKGGVGVKGYGGDGIRGGFGGYFVGGRINGSGLFAQATGAPEQGSFAIEANGAIKCATEVPATSDLPNVIAANTVAKAWAVFQNPAPADAAVPLNGFNIKSITHNGPNLRVTFSHAINNYGVWVSGMFAGANIPGVIGKTDAYADIGFWSVGMSGAAACDMSSQGFLGVEIYVLVFGSHS